MSYLESDVIIQFPKLRSTFNSIPHGLKLQGLNRNITIYRWCLLKKHQKRHDLAISHGTEWWMVLVTRCCSVWPLQFRALLPQPVWRACKPTGLPNSQDESVFFASIPAFLHLKRFLPISPSFGKSWFRVGPICQRSCWVCIVCWNSLYRQWKMFPAGIGRSPGAQKPRGRQNTSQEWWYNMV